VTGVGRKLVLPGLMTAVMLVLAIVLGVWQVQRLQWKTALLADIDRGEAAPAIPLPAEPRPFTKVRVEGQLRQDLAALYGTEVRITAAGPKLGAFLLNPLERPGAAPIIVDRGWVPNDVARPTAVVPMVIEGYVRAAEHPLRFGVADDPSVRQFYALDPVTIGASLGLKEVAPFTLVVLGRAPRGVYPAPASVLPRPVNNHLIYAITWFGLGAALLGVFGVYVRSVRRGPVA